MALTDDEATLVTYLRNHLSATAVDDDLMDAYYAGEQRLRHIGIAVPESLRAFVTIVNWPRLVVDALEERCDVKSFIRGDQDSPDDELREGWDANNLDSEFSLTLTDSLVNGRGYLSVGSNEGDPDHPIIAVESPREMTVEVDPRTRRVTSALKLYGGDETPLSGSNTTSATIGPPKYATLYLPNETKWLSVDNLGQWVEVDRDQHNVGRVPVVPFLNRRRSGRWWGVSEMSDAITLTDAAARTLTNLQIAAETHSVPQRWVLGASKGDFVDADGNQLPAWQAYFSSIWAMQSKDAKAGQFSASDLRNFHETVSHYAGLLAGVYGLPIRYFGQNTANPPSADGIRADEARLVKRAERVMQSAGDQLGRVMALYLRFKNGSFPESGDRIKVEWHDAATPTYAAKADAVQKLTGGQPILSREGGWDELGWSDARKAREKANLAAEAADPVLERITRELMGAPATPSGSQPLPVPTAP